MVPSGRTEFLLPWNTSESGGQGETSGRRRRKGGAWRSKQVEQKAIRQAVQPGLRGQQEQVSQGVYMEVA